MKRDEFLQNTVNSYIYMYVSINIHIYIYEKIKIVMSVNNVREIKPQIQPDKQRKKAPKTQKTPFILGIVLFVLK